MLKILSGREKNLVYFTITVIIFSLIFNFIIIPIINKYTFLNKEISFTTAKLRKYLTLLSQKQILVSNYDKFSSDVTVKEDNSVVGALAELENLAVKSGMRIIDIRPQASSNNENYKEIGIELKTDGKLEEYLKFVYNAENSLLLLRIEKIQLTPLPNSQALEGNITIKKLLL